MGELCPSRKRRATHTRNSLVKYWSRDRGTSRKTSPPRFLEESHGHFLQAQERRESSMMVRNGESGWVDNVYVTESLDSGLLVEFRLEPRRYLNLVISLQVDTVRRV